MEKTDLFKDLPDVAGKLLIILDKLLQEANETNKEEQKKNAVNDLAAVFISAGVEQTKKAWYEENAPFGRELGYPECCIKEFCEQPPALLNMRTEVPQIDKDRYEAGCLHGSFTGFIPCSKHALQILKKEIQLQDLIQNRNPEYPIFPNVW